MAAIPDSTLPGHRQLHERVVAALDLCQEARDVDFKESASWENLKYKITRTALGMANLRDGGVIIVGVSERDNTWSRTGIAEADLSTYREDEINDFANRFASPPLRLELVRVEYDSNPYLAIQCPEFEQTPVVCRRDAPEGAGLRRGGIYVRPIGKPETTQVSDASQLEELLELAVEKRVTRFLRTAERVGLEPVQSADTSFDEQLEGL